MSKKESRKLDVPALLFFLILAPVVNVPAVLAQDSSPTPYEGKQILILIGPQYGFLIMGKDDHKAPFLAPILKAVDDLPKKLHIETMADLPYEEMLERVATLPRDAIAFYGSFFHDITGRSFVPAKFAGRVAETANRPVFAFRDTHIVQGLAGGSVTITSELGKQAALIGLEYLAGNLRLAQPVTPFELPNAPLFDWRQLKRWGGDVNKLPAGTIFLNRPPTLWSQH